MLLHTRFDELCKANQIVKTIEVKNTFHGIATTVTLDNGVPIETISKMLRHASIKTTQIYVEITNQRLAKDLTALAKTANRKYKISKRG